MLNWLWKIRSIEGDMSRKYEDMPHAGQFIHIQIPDSEKIKIKAIEDEDND